MALAVVCALIQGVAGASSSSTRSNNITVTVLLVLQYCSGGGVNVTRRGTGSRETSLVLGYDKGTGSCLPGGITVTPRGRMATPGLKITRAASVDQLLG